MSKISIKHYINTSLKGSEANGVIYYPIYIQITYKRKNTNFASESNTDFASEYNRTLNPNVDIEDLKDSEIVGSIFKEEERVITDIILHEETLSKDSFNLKELKKKYEFYKKPLHSVLNNYLIPKIGEYMFAKEEFEPYDGIYDFKKISNSFSSPRESFKDYLFSITNTIPKFKEIVKKDELNNQKKIFTSNGYSFSQEIQAYEAFCEYCNPKAHRQDNITPRLIDWVNNKFKKGFLIYLHNSNTHRETSSTIIDILDTILLNYNVLLY